MSPFYKPISLTINKIPVVAYSMTGLEKKLSIQDKLSIRNHLNNLYEVNTDTCSKGVYHIVILWIDFGEVMTDIWQYLQLESEESGYTVDCLTFKGSSLIEGDGITASDGLIMLGRETELSEKMRKDGKSVNDYIFGERPALPESIHPTVSYYSS